MDRWSITAGAARGELRACGGAPAGDRAQGAPPRAEGPGTRQGPRRPHAAGGDAPPAGHRAPRVPGGRRPLPRRCLPRGGAGRLPLSIRRPMRRRGGEAGAQAWRTSTPGTRTSQDRVASRWPTTTTTLPSLSGSRPTSGTSPVTWRHGSAWPRTPRRRRGRSDASCPLALADVGHADRPDPGGGSKSRSCLSLTIGAWRPTDTRSSH